MAKYPSDSEIINEVVREINEAIAAAKRSISTLEALTSHAQVAILPRPPNLGEDFRHLDAATDEMRLAWKTLDALIRNLWAQWWPGEKKGGEA